MDESTRAVLALPSQLLQVSAPVGGGVPDWETLAAAHPWVRTSRLVAKPDQLIKRRGKGGLLALNVDWAGAVAWITERMGKPVVVEGVTGTLTHFLVEPFVPHPAVREHMLARAA